MTRWADGRRWPAAGGPQLLGQLAEHRPRCGRVGLQDVLERSRGSSTTVLSRRARTDGRARLAGQQGELAQHAPGPSSRTTVPSTSTSSRPDARVRRPGRVAGAEQLTCRPARRPDAWRAPAVHRASAGSAARRALGQVDAQLRRPRTPGWVRVGHRRGTVGGRSSSPCSTVTAPSRRAAAPPPPRPRRQHDRQHPAVVERGDRGQRASGHRGSPRAPRCPARRRADARSTPRPRRSRTARPGTAASAALPSSGRSLRRRCR